MRLRLRTVRGRHLLAVCSLLLSINRVVAQAPATPVATSQANHNFTCTIVTPANTSADQAFSRRSYAEAEALYRTQLTAATSDTDRSAANAGVLRSQVAAGRLGEAFTAAKTAVAEHPRDANLLDVLGEIYFRRGETGEAATAWTNAMHLDPCNPRTHFDVARYFRLNGMYASEQRQLDAAARVSPRDTTFARAAAPHIQGSAEERLAWLTQRLHSDQISTEERAALQRTIDVVQAQSKGNCQIVRPMDNVKLQIVPIANGPQNGPQDMYAAGLDVQLNGHRKRLEIDTGASGLLISRSVAASAGLVTEAQSMGGGIGDEGLVKELLAHVDSIRIGALEFHNCLVRIFDKRNVLDIDGLIGPDVFSPWVVTLDIPSSEVRLSPLPRRPQDTASAGTTELDTAGEGANSEAAPQDRYIAPEMKDWTPVFRYAHNLIFPTFLGNAPSKLFIMDTGAGHTLVSPAAAREVTKVGGSDARIKGISGEVNKVFEADDITIGFARIRAPLRGVTAIDTSVLGRGAGVEISGLIGFETLRELVISIDYRDNLVHIVYDPRHGTHRH